MKFQRLVVSVTLFSVSSHALASFSADNPSINGTGETLEAGRGEVGLASLSYGINDQLLLTIPTLPLLIGYYSAGLRYKTQLNHTMRLSPEASIFTSSSTGAGASGGVTLGFDFDKPSGRRADKSGASFNSFDLGVNISTVAVSRARFEVSDSSEAESTWDVPDTLVTAHLEFNHYTSAGNLFYIGAMSTVVPYIGFTWAFESVHVGLVASPLVFFLPLPYIYWRF